MQLHGYIIVSLLFYYLSNLILSRYDISKASHIVWRRRIPAPSPSYNKNSKNFFCFRSILARELLAVCSTSVSNFKSRDILSKEFLYFFWANFERVVLNHFLDHIIILISHILTWSGLCESWNSEKWGVTDQLLLPSCPYIIDTDVSIFILGT